MQTYVKRFQFKSISYLEFKNHFEDQVKELFNDSYENILNTRGNDLGHSNNENDWTIRSQAPKCANASIWRRFRDYNGVGLRKLATFNEDLRDSPSSL